MPTSRKHERLPAFRQTGQNMRVISLIFLLSFCAQSQVIYDLLLKGGHVIDPKNKISGRRDVAIAQKKIALVAEDIPAAKAYKVVDVSRFYVTPGLVDIHTHVFAGDPERPLNVYPDSHTLRAGVTT